MLVPAGALLLATSEHKALRQIAICDWILVSGFLMPMLAFAGSKIIPLILESILTVLFFVLLQRLAQNPAAKYGQPANNL